MSRDGGMQVAEPALVTHGLRVVDECDDSVTVQDRPPGGPASVAQRRAIRVPGVGTFTVTDGTRIRVARVPGADPAEVAATLRGRATAALLQQRGTLPLHLSAVVVGGRAVGVAGPPGVGKSSLACAFAARGHRLVTDDLAAVGWTEQGRPAVHPGPTTMRVWGSTARQLGWPTDDDHRISPGLDKYAYDLADRFVSGPLRLGAVYVLVAGCVTGIEVHRLTGFAAFEAYFSGATYNREYLDTPDARAWHFAQASRIADQVPTFAVGVPSGDLPLAQLAAAIAVRTSSPGPLR